MKNYWLLFAILIILTSCISRLARPGMSGIIVDFDGNPIDSCRVGETYTDSNGYFELKEKRKGKFLLSEIMIMEAPPLFVLEEIYKPNYEPKAIHIFSKYGGGSPKGTHWKMDTVYLKMKDYKITTSFLTEEWLVSATKDLDTLFLIKKDFNSLCKTADCSEFYNIHQSYTDNYLDSFGPNNLPDSVIRKKIELNLSNEKLLIAKKIIQYGDKDGKVSFDKENDTLKSNGDWHFENDKVTLNSSFIELNGQYKVAKYDYEYVMLVQSKL